MSASQLARQRSASSHLKPVSSSQSKGRSSAVAPSFEPCAATASLFLYAQGTSILCLHHDTLAVERRFEKHVDDVQLICVDNVSERGAGRLVVSYDRGQTAIVWDLFSGQEIARFASFEHITVAAWMRNGNVAFGNSKGEVILFEPSTSEHISARTIYDPITALAPSADCKAYAIGYNNGSILLATLQPAFTILHTLTTQRAPSPIAALAWHASSSKQKSDMLATQTSDGDLRVWSVAKPPTGEAPRVIRALRRSDDFSPGQNWISWSKNGRVVQYCEGQAWSWDVRTKHVTWEVVPTVEDVRGLSAYGPTATLFTLGPDHTVQQYDLDRPQMVANVQHLPIALLATPPEEFNRQLGPSASESEEEIGSPITRANRQITASEAARIERAQTGSPRSTRSRTESQSSQASSAQERSDNASPVARVDANSTVFSLGTQSQLCRDPLPTSSSMTYPSSMQSPVSIRSARKGSRLKQEVLPSPEEKGVQKPVKELFPYTRSRLSDIPYKPARALDEQSLTQDDLRRQMLSVVFGWGDDIQGLIRDEMSRHPRGSQSAVLLSKWLDDDPDHMASMMGAGGTPSSLDWMMLALSGIGNQAQSKKVGQAFVEKMLAISDIHAAATILLSLGDYNDAIEVYVTRNHFMEAILLTCLLMPQNWQRISFLVREWGKDVVENSEQHLAIRCFSCTGVEPSEPWTSPTAQMAAKFTEQAYSGQGSDAGQPSGLRREFMEAPTPVAMDVPQPPVKTSLPARMTAKNPALKLITSFGPQNQGHYQFPGLKSDDRTPTNAPGITPIAESAIGESAMTPGGLGSYRLNNARSLNSALSARTATPGGFPRQRLPSIGETPIDVNPPAFPSTAPKALPTPVDSGSDKEKELALGQNGVQLGCKPTTDLPPLLTSARYEPSDHTPSRETPLTAVAPQTTIKLQPLQNPPSPPQGIFDSLKGESGTRNGSRGRKPDGLSIHWPPAESTMNEAETDEMATLAAGLQRTDTAGTYIDTHSEMTSPPTTGNSFRTLKSPSISGRSIDQYISSLEEAQYYSKHHRRHRTGSRDRSRGQDGERKRSKHRLRAPSEEDRGRRRVIPASKRSPSSPVPMSPDDLNLYNASVESFDSMLQSRSEAGSTKPERSQAKSSSGKYRSGSKTGERHRQRSNSRHVETHKSRPSSRAVSHRHSPDAAYESRGRTRSKSKREESGLRSPSSPLPMSPSGSDRPKYSEAEQALRFVSSDRQRLHGRHRSTSRSLSRRPERETSTRRDVSPDRRKGSRARSGSRQARGREPGLTRKISLSYRDEGSTPTRHRDSSADRRHREEIPAEPLVAGRTAQFSEHEREARAASSHQFAADRRRKELAAAELEARRLSLARRPSAPAIPFPGQNMSPIHSKSRSTGGAPPLIRSQTDDSVVTAIQSHNFNGRMHAKHSPTDPFSSGANSPSKSSLNSRIGLPATPRAMRHPALSPPSGDDSVSELPKNNMTLSSDLYQAGIPPDLPRSMSAPISDVGSPPIPADLPAHPAFDRRLPSSRSSSKNRDGTFSPPGGRNRDPSRERLRISPREVLFSGRTTTSNVEVAPSLPELQHLATPPPPPPLAPSVTHHSPIVHDGDVVTVGWPDPSTLVEVGPTTAPPLQSSFSENPQTRHRRGRSINENFAGKIRSITTRLRSTSRGRNTKSPPTEEETPSPYESLPVQVDFGVA
jgi:hypothetical protein